MSTTHQAFTSAALDGLRALSHAAVLAPLVEFVAAQLPQQPAALRADLLEALAVIAPDEAQAAAAARAAAAIRDAEAHQLTFLTMLAK